MEEDRQEHLNPARQVAGSGTMNQFHSPYTPTALNVYDTSAYESPYPDQATQSASPSSADMYFSPPSADSAGEVPPVSAYQGRSAISPLPSLGELRQLHRANSAAGRLIAMKKLMGEAPPSPTSLQRAGSLGSSTMLESSEMSPSKRRRRVGILDPVAGIGDHTFGDDSQEDLFPPSPTTQGFPTSSTQPFTSHDISDPTLTTPSSSASPFPLPQSRPRLGRSNTIANGGGEERRSVIGRRMIMRLGGRVAAQAQAEDADAQGATIVEEGDGGSALPARGNPFAVLERRMAAQALAAASGSQAPPAARANPFAALERRMQQYQHEQEQAGSVFASQIGDQGAVSEQGQMGRGLLVEQRAHIGETGQNTRSSMEQGIEAAYGPDHSGIELAEEPVTDEESRTPDQRRKSAAEAIFLGGAWAPQSHFTNAISSPPMPLINHFQQDPHSNLHPPPVGSSLQRSNSGASTLAGGGAAMSSGLGQEDPLARSASRMTAQSEMSGGDMFEYEAHLRRSLSERRQGGGTPSIRAGATPVFGYNQPYEPGGIQDGHEAMPEDLREMLDDQAGVIPLERSPVQIRGLPVSPDCSTVKALPTTPGRFADAEDSYRISHINPATADAPHELLPPIAPFAGYDSPASRKSLQPAHNQSPSGSSINSTNTLDPMAKMPFIIPGSDVTSSPATRQLANDRNRMISLGGESLSNYPGEAVTGSDQGSSGYDPKSVVMSDIFPSSYPVTPERRHDDNATERDRYLGATESSEATPIVQQGNFGHYEPDAERVDNPPWEDFDVGAPPSTSKVQKKRSVVLDKMRGAFRRNRSGSRDRDGLASPLVSPTLDDPYQRSSRAESVESGSQPNESDYLVASEDPSRKNSLNVSMLSTTPSVLPPGQVSPLPLVEAGDPRLLNSKLFPSPGVPNLVPPPLLQQVSDSVVPALQQSMISPNGSARSSLTRNVSAAGSAVMAYYDLPPRTQSPVDGTTVGKKSWLAEAFFAPTGSSFLSKRRSSIPEITHRRPSGPDIAPAQLAGGTGPMPMQSEESAMSTTSQHSGDISPSPALTPALLDEHRSPRLFAQSPTVSTVMEGTEDARSTVYHQASNATSVHRSANPSPMTEEGAGPLAASIKGKPVARATSLVLKRLDSVLSLSVDDAERPDVLDDPPRRLALFTPVLQVVNGHTVKDRHLFLFSDVLVIAKPLTPDGSIGSLDDHFAVKSVVALHQLNLMLPPGEDRSGDTASSSKQHPVVANFIESFRRDPGAAVAYLEQKSQLQDDPVTLASLLFKSAELDKEQLGRYLSEASNATLAKAFMNRFHFVGIRIDEALRTFLLAIRLPTEAVASERLLEAFATGWHRVNASSVAFSVALTSDLVLAILQLNDALNPNTGFGYFAFANQVIGVEDFVMAFRAKDSRDLVPQGLLEAVYLSIKGEKMVQAVRTAEQESLREVLVTPSRLPSRLTHNSWSERIYVSIPAPDARFGVRLHGEGLLFDPPYLDFSNSTEESFRVMGSSLGVKSMLFSRVGANAPLYSNLPNTKTFSVERSFMRHTFQVAFTNHVGVKRKYCFSVEDAEVRAEWIQGLEQRVARVQAERAARQGTPHLPLKARFAADAVALKVLQDTLIPGEDERTTIQGGRKHNVPVQERKGSVSARYAIADGEGASTPDTSLGPSGRPKLGPSTSGRKLNTLASLAEDEVDPGTSTVGQSGFGRSYGRSEAVEPLPPKAQTGKDIVLVCRQNSLLPVVLGFLQVGRGADQVDTPKLNLVPRRTAIQI